MPLTAVNHRHPATAAGACAVAIPLIYKPLKRRKPSPPPPPVAPFTRETIQKISSILRYSPWRSAEHQLRLLPVHWDSFTVNRVLKTHPPMEKAWLFFNWAGRLHGFRHDHFTYTTMLDIFGEAGRIASMRRVLTDMEEKGVRIDAAAYTSAMHWIAKSGDFDGAVEIWKEMRRGRSCRPTKVSYTAFMKVLFDNGQPEAAARVYREMLELGIRPNCFTYTVMMEYLMSAGLFKDALTIMDEMQAAGIQPDKAACNILVHKCSIAGETAMISHVLRYMKETSIVLRRSVFLDALAAFRTSGESDRLLREVNPHFEFEGIMEEDRDSELAFDDPVYISDRSIIIHCLTKRNLISIDRILNSINEKEVRMDSYLLSAIVLANCEKRSSSGALLAFRCALKAGYVLEKSAYIALIGLFLRLKLFHMISEIVEEIVRHGISFSAYLLCVLIHQLGRAGFSDSVGQMFASFPTNQCCSTYTALMNALFQSGDVESGLKLFSRMKMEEISVSCGTYEVLISGLNSAGRFHDADVYKKEKRNLQRLGFSRGTISADEVFCDRFFGYSMFHVPQIGFES